MTFDKAKDNDEAKREEEMDVISRVEESHEEMAHEDEPMVFKWKRVWGYALCSKLHVKKGWRRIEKVGRVCVAWDIIVSSN